MALLVLLSAVTALWSVPDGSATIAVGDSPVGSFRGSITWDGLTRNYLIHVPPAWDQSSHLPLVLALHGGNGTADDMVRMTRGGFDRLADTEGFIVVYPEGLSHARPIRTRWNDGRDPKFSEADDVGFLSALIDHLGQTLNIDRHRVYATGISNGAQMVVRLARDLPDKIAAVAPVAYSMPEKVAATFVSTRAISVLVMTGTKDPSVPWEGGDTPDPTGERRLGRVLSVPETLRVLARHNLCSASPRVEWVRERQSGDRAEVRRESWTNCKEGAEVVLYAIEGGGHTWPGGARYSAGKSLGKANQDIDPSAIIWGFFKRHAR
jgi:polyhydroxybutyrate depolymerase